MSTLTPTDHVQPFDFRRNSTPKIEEILERCQHLEIEVVGFNKSPRKPSRFIFRVHPSNLKISADKEMIIDLKSTY